jgi:hypothetical protein
LPGGSLGDLRFRTTSLHPESSDDRGEGIIYLWELELNGAFQFKALFDHRGCGGWC